MRSGSLQITLLRWLLVVEVVERKEPGVERTLVLLQDCQTHAVACHQPRAELLTLMVMVMDGAENPEL